MRVRKLSPTGDYTWGQSSGNFYVNDPAGVGQTVQTQLLLWLGEWFLDNTIGTPYLQGVLGKYSQQMADTVIQDQVLQNEWVTNIVSYQSTLNPETRLMSIQMTINTIYGPTAVQIANYEIY